MTQGQRVAPAHRTKLDEDGNQMPVAGDAFPVFILGYGRNESRDLNSYKIGGADAGLLGSSQINHFQSAESLVNCNT
jgi:hypothetical protein